MLFWISSLLAGVCLGCFLLLALAPVQQGSSRSPEGRWPVLLRLTWPWITACAHLCTPFLSWRQRIAINRRLQVAGFDPFLRAEHIAGMQCLLVIAVLVTVMGAAVVYSGWDLRIMVLAVAACFLTGWLPRHWLQACGRRRQQDMLREFPFLLDMTTLCVEAGLNLQGALQQAAHHAPAGPLRHELRQALADMRTGVSRLEALEKMAQRTGLPALQHLVTSLAQADQLGMSLGPLLRAQSEQRRNERFLRAEKMALEAPVKMLFPLVFCIFPCSFLIIGFPVVVKFLEVGW